MKFLPILALASLLPFVSACEQGDKTKPVAFALTEEAMGRYCGMNVLEHPGPKGQVILDQVLEPIWFSSVRDTVAFTMLPDEPKDIAAIYVSDMTKAPSWESPGAENWTDARTAHYVIHSGRKGGMGADELVPFSSRAAAELFARENGGIVVAFQDIPKADVLGDGGAEASGSAPGSDKGGSNG